MKKNNLYIGKGEKMKCENCNKYEARIKDYRDIEGNNQKLISCLFCANLDNVAHYQIRAEGIDPIDFYDELFFNKMGDDELLDVREVLYNRINEQIKDNASLDMLLEMERELTKREE